MGDMNVAGATSIFAMKASMNTAASVLMLMKQEQMAPPPPAPTPRAGSTIDIRM